MPNLPGKALTVRIPACGLKNDRTARYDLDDSTQLSSVASFSHEVLPVDEWATSPSSAAIAAALESEPGTPPWA